MGRAGVEISLGVVVRPLVFVVHEQTDGRAEGNTVFGPGLEVDGVVLGALIYQLKSLCRSERSDQLTAVVMSLCPGRRLESWT